MTRLSLGRAHMLVSTLMRESRRAGVPVDVLTPVGDLRRFSPDVGDVAVLGVAPRARHAQILKAFAALPLATEIVHLDPSAVTVGAGRGAVRISLTVPEQAGSTLVRHTGSHAHLHLLEQRAAHVGVTFTPSTLAATEDEIYARLDLPFIAPELREGLDEVDAAERGELPSLITEAHIRGDLHLHSTWSDGRDSIGDMVRAARQLGYEYIAITDHSERAGASRTVAAVDVPAQREEVEALRRQHPAIQILHGIEVDILHDGTLDFDDACLDGFDIVLASLHDHAGHDGPRLTERYLQAIAHPLVNVITHPANRSPGRSPGYDVDFDRVFAAAAETGTAMEIDGAPGHLDMDGALARRAAAAGVTLVVNSDCHRSDALARQMRFGIGTARRGWVEPGYVLNTRDVDAIRSFVAAKRRRG